MAEALALAVAELLLEQTDRLAALARLKSDVPALKLGPRQRIINDACKEKRETGAIDLERLAGALQQYMDPLRAINAATPAPPIPAPPTPAPPTSMPAKPETLSAIVCFMACHAATAARVADLARALGSLWSQRLRPPRVLLSWSATAEAASGVRELLRRFAAEARPLEAFEQQRRLSQFEHFEQLTKRAVALRANPVRWVAFANDDDINSERRFSLLAAQCRRADEDEACGEQPPVKVLQCRRKARPKYVLGADRQPPDAAAVRALLQSDDAQLMHTQLMTRAVGDKAPSVGEHGMEYFDLVVRLEVLRGFLSKAPAEVLQHRFCDLAFIFAVREGGWGAIHAFDFDESSGGLAELTPPPIVALRELGTARPATDLEFVYFCARSQAELDVGGHGLSSAAASVGLMIGAVEQQIARQAAAAVEAQLRHKGAVEVSMGDLRAYGQAHRRPAHAPAHQGVSDATTATNSGATDRGERPAAADEMDAADTSSVLFRLTRLLAHIRQGIESELVQLRTSANALHASTTDDIVKRELALGLGGSDFFPQHVLSQARGCLRAWIAGVARGPLLFAALHSLGFIFVYSDVGQSESPAAWSDHEFMRSARRPAASAPSAPGTKSGMTPETMPGVEVVKVDPTVENERLVRVDGSVPPADDGEASRMLEGAHMQSSRQRYLAPGQAAKEDPSLIAVAVYYAAGRDGVPPPPLRG